MMTVQDDLQDTMALLRIVIDLTEDDAVKDLHPLVGEIILDRSPSEIVQLVLTTHVLLKHALALFAGDRGVPLDEVVGHLGCLLAQVP